MAAINALRQLRRDSAVFAGRNSFATLRDLFRWADRYAREGGAQERDWDRHLALDGYHLLAGRCRSEKECEQVKETLEGVFKRKLGSDDEIYSLEAVAPIIEKLANTGRFVWGSKSRKMAVLLGRALKFDEPVLLVGPTGCGKTTIVQMLSPRGLKIINCHQQTEASDFLGGLRPVRDQNSDALSSGLMVPWSNK